MSTSRARDIADIDQELSVADSPTFAGLTVGLNNYPSAGPLSNRNILINGNLNVNQRSLSIASVATGAYGEDRWKKTAGGMTQIVEEVNYLSSTVYTLSGTGVTTQQITSPASGNWTLPDIPVTARLIQLEVGDTATPFEHRSYGQELALCQRYYFTTWPTGTATGTNIVATENLGVAMAGNSIKVVDGGLTLPVEMRVTPSVSVMSATGVATKYYVRHQALDFSFNLGSGIWAGTKYIGLSEYDPGAVADRAGYTHLFCDAEL